MAESNMQDKASTEGMAGEIIHAWIWAEGSANDPENYRPLCVLSHGRKLVDTALKV